MDSSIDRKREGEGWFLKKGGRGNLMEMKERKIVKNYNREKEKSWEVN